MTKYPAIFMRVEVILTTLISSTWNYGEALQTACPRAYVTNNPRLVDGVDWTDPVNPKICYSGYYENADGERFVRSARCHIGDGVGFRCQKDKIGKKECSSSCDGVYYGCSASKAVSGKEGEWSQKEGVTWCTPIDYLESLDGDPYREYYYDEENAAHIKAVLTEALARCTCIPFRCTDCSSNGFYNKGCNLENGLVFDAGICEACPAGSYCRDGDKLPCNVGYFCPQEGSTSPTQRACPAGTYSTAIGAASIDECDDISCPPSRYCEAGSSTQTGTGLCKAGNYCAGGDKTRFGTGTCAAGVWCPEGSATPQGDGPCPEGYLCGEGADALIPCPDGRLCKEGTGRVEDTLPCPEGSFCSGGVTSPCLAGYCCTEGSASLSSCIDCTEGLSADADVEVFCPPGTGSTSFVVASGRCGIISSDRAAEIPTISNSEMRATFEDSVECGVRVTPSYINETHYLKPPNTLDDSVNTRRSFTIVNEGNTRTIAWKWMFLVTKAPSEAAFDGDVQDVTSFVVIEIDSTNSAVQPGESVEVSTMISSLSHNDEWGKYGGFLDGTVLIEWWLIDDVRSLKISPSRFVSIDLKLTVSSRVPGLVLPSSLRMRADLGSNLTSDLSVYAVGEGTVRWSATAVAAPCEARANYREIDADNNLLGSDATSWVSVVGKLSGLKTPGDGLPVLITVLLDTTKVLVTSDSNEEDSIDIFDLQTKQGCIIVTMSEDGENGVKFFDMYVPIVLEIVDLCPAGSVSDTGRTPCTACPADYFQATRGGQIACTSCRTLTDRTVRASTFGLVGADTPDACVECPDGARCIVEFAPPRESTGSDETEGENDSVAGGSAIRVIVKAMNGYAREPLCTSDVVKNGRPAVSFYECDRVFSCLGAPNPSLMPKYEGLGSFNEETVDTANGTAIVTPTPAAGANITYSEMASLNFAEGCAAGYEGSLCLACVAGRAKSSKLGPCTECLSFAAGVALSFLWILIATVGILILIKTAIETGEQKSVGVELLKITFSHIQLLAVMREFPLRWPGAINSLYTALGTISVSGSAVFFPDCVLKPSVAAKTFGSAFYVRCFAIALVPVIAGLSVFAFWRLRTSVAGLIVTRWGAGGADTWSGKVKRKLAVYLAISPKESRQKARLSIVVLSFVLHLMLVQTALQLFVCKAVRERSSCVDAEYYYLEADHTVQCWGQTHSRWAFGLGVPMLGFYGIGIPLTAFNILMHRRKKLQEARCIKVYGFLYCSFKPTYFFWDCLIYFRKASFAIVGAILVPYGAEMQCSIGICILFVAHLLQTHLRPYKKESLNRAESFGLLCSLGTLFCGTPIFPTCYLKTKESV